MKTTVLLIKHKLGKHIHFGNGSRQKFIELIIYGSNAVLFAAIEGKSCRSASDILTN